MGIATILASRRIVLLASGSNKAIAIKNAIEGPVSPACPASALQLHPAATAIIDTTAAALLSPATVCWATHGSSHGTQPEHQAAGDGLPPDENANRRLPVPGVLLVDERAYRGESPGPEYRA